MSNESNTNIFILNDFIKNADRESIPKVHKDLLLSILNVHIAHISLHKTATSTTVDLFSLVVAILKRAIDEGSASTETKEIIGKIKIIAENLDRSLENNVAEYNEQSSDLIKTLNDLGIH